MGSREGLESDRALVVVVQGIEVFFVVNVVQFDILCRLLIVSRLMLLGGKEVFDVSRVAVGHCVERPQRHNSGHQRKDQIARDFTPALLATVIRPSQLIVSVDEEEVEDEPEVDGTGCGEHDFVEEQIDGPRANFDGQLAQFGACSYA